MPDAKRPLKVFLCHAHDDKLQVRELYQRLKSEGWIDPWIDEDKLTLGQHLTSVIESALDDADVVIIFLSRNSVQKEGFVQRELNYAWDLSLEKPREVIFLIPFRLDDCEVPRHLRSRQWGDYFGQKKDGTYNTLLKSLNIRHEQKLKLEAEDLARSEKPKRTPKTQVKEPAGKKPRNKPKTDPAKTAMGLIKQQIRLKTNNIGNVFDFLQDRLQKIYPAEKRRVVELNNFPDGIKRTITHTYSLSIPYRGQNK